MKCPSAVRLEEAYWNDEITVLEHAASCDVCGSELAEIASLDALVDTLLPPPASANRVVEIRAALVTPPTTSPRKTDRRPYAAIAIAAAVAGLALSMWPRTPEVQHRGRVDAHEGARFWTSSTQPDEIVRLADGTITVTVDHLRAGERFRVVTADAEVEVRGTAFDVVARDDRLLSVRVASGRVEVRRAGRTVVLSAGDRFEAPKPPPVSRPKPALEPAPEPPPPQPPQPPKRRAARRTPTKPTPAPAPPVATDRVVYESAWTALRAQDFSGASKAFERCLVETDDDALREDASYWLGVALARAGRLSDAREVMARFIDQYPDSTHAPDAAAALGWLYYDVGEPDRARPYFRRAANGTGRAKRSGQRGLDTLQHEAGEP